MEKQNTTELEMNQSKMCSNRLIEAEEFLLEIANMPWYQRIFLAETIIKFLNSRSKYDIKSNGKE